MRRPLIFASIALVAAMFAICGTTGLVATSPRKVSADSSIDVMQMMREAKGLPEEKFDAH